VGKLKGKSLLVVDDEPDLREILRDELEALDGKVFDAENGTKAFKIFENNAIDAVISDIRMAGGDGIELLKKIRAAQKRQPIVILITGFADYSNEEVIKLGANAILTKPFDILKVRDKMVELLKL
jgi:CheY-like chemotaxis protein